MSFYITGESSWEKRFSELAKDSCHASADEKFDATMKVNAVVQHNGDILYVPPGIFKSICPFDIAAFPFVRLAARTSIFGILFSPVFRIHKHVR